MTKSILAALTLLPFLFGSAHAVCKHPQLACTAITECMTGVTPPNDRKRIFDGMDQGNGQLIYDGTQACHNDGSFSTKMDDAFKACSNDEYVTIARGIIANKNDRSWCMKYPEDTGSLPTRTKPS